MLNLAPGETFRHLLTFFEVGRDGPRLDLTDIVVEAINLNDAPWVIQVLATDPINGQCQIYIPDADTQLAEPGVEYAFQLRMTFPSGDKRFIPPVVIALGPEYVG